MAGSRQRIFSGNHDKIMDLDLRNWGETADYQNFLKNALNDPSITQALTEITLTFIAAALRSPLASFKRFVCVIVDSSLLLTASGETD